MSATVTITLWTDPACPFAFSAEPARLRLRWLYGEQLSWRPRMIVLTREEGHAERLAGGGAGLQAQYGMPISAWPYPRPASCEPACLAVVAARELADSPEVAERLLRALRVRTMAGGLIDEPSLLDAAAGDAGLSPEQLRAWMRDPVARRALEDDAAGARDPSDRARALDHKLGGPAHERRYTAPSYELERADGTRRIGVPGLNPVEVYETAVANVAPELERRPEPDSVTELLTWAAMPLATAEVVEIMRRPQVGDLGLQASHRDLEQQLRDELGRSGPVARRGRLLLEPAAEWVIEPPKSPAAAYDRGYGAADRLPVAVDPPAASRRRRCRHRADRRRRHRPRLKAPARERDRRRGAAQEGVRRHRPHR